MLTLQVTNPVGLSVISRSCQSFLYPSFIAYLFQTSTIVLFNTMILRFGHGLIWSFSGSFKNSRLVIISATRYGITIKHGLMSKAEFEFGMTQNACSHSLWCIIVFLVLALVLFSTVVLNLLLTYILVGLFTSTFYYCKVSIGNHGPRVLLFDILVLFFFS